MNLKDVKNLCKKYGIRPLKRLGQNFLIDEMALEGIIKASNLSKSDIVLEIGPGLGNLTLELAKNVKKVVAIEKDKEMIKILKEVLGDSNIKNVEIIQKDVLKFDPQYKILSAKYKLVANLPYYITSPVIRKFLELKKPPRLMVLTLQKEVAQRICSKPPKMSILSVSVQFYAQPEIISFISKESFWPQPKVDSAIIKIVPHKIKVPWSPEIRDQFFRIVKAGFSQPRKQLV
ncbi:MAG: 16S rRNA (adenine(1518)-N(6)/adenine(1519)-N(6))-dimethyltransferase RsmA, partial [Patescibacteria group bacterium]|nr:16S rRNA (adenine(1518)-N(6)/adenine(1519)-N(6))-dimethyltransferase RsmA [Patescibacteria group bacterium]